MKKALLFGINDYDGAANDLRGCVNDVLQWEELLVSLGFTVTKFINDQVTRSNFEAQVNKLFSESLAGDILFISYSGHGTQVFDRSGDESDGYDEALYLYDGALTDDRINGLSLNKPAGSKLIWAFDSCFSGTGTRAQDELNLIRFHPADGKRHYKVRRINRRGLVRNGMEYLYLSGCAEDQTSADAFIAGDYHGAFTWFAVENFKQGLTYKEWHKAYLSDLKAAQFEQTPQLEGNTDWFNTFAFDTKKKECWLKRLFK